MSLAAIWLIATVSPPPMEGNGREFFGLWRTHSIAVAIALLWAGFGMACAKLGFRTRARFALVSGSALATWLLLEVLGLSLVSWPDLIGSKRHLQMGMLAIPHLDVTGEAHEDLASSWGYPAPPIAFHFKTDSRGFRNEPDRASADVYCVGDSILVGGLVAWPDTLAAGLERATGRSVMNVALVGLSPQAEHKLFMDSGLPISGRLVLHFVFEGNDLLDSAAWRRGRVGEEDRLPLAQRTFLFQLAWRLQLLTQPRPAYAAAHVGRIGDKEYLFEWPGPTVRGLEDELPAITDCLDEFRSEVESAGGQYAVVVVPASIRVLGPYCRFPERSGAGDYTSHCSPLPAHLHAWSERTGCDLLDLTTDLVDSTRVGAVPYFPGDTHWNATGHRVAAEAIARWNLVKSRGVRSVGR